MRNFLTLLLFIGMVIAGWMNRDKISQIRDIYATANEDSGSTPDAPRAVPTPHPGTEAQARAVALYPGLTMPNSALNQKFVALYKEAQATDPTLLSRPDWPIQLAERAVKSLGGAPMPSQQGPPTASGTRPVGNGKQVVIYTTSHCPYCKQAKQYFAQKGIPYREVDVESSLSGKEAFKRAGGNGVPLIMVGSQKVDGFDAKQLDRLLL